MWLVTWCDKKFCQFNHSLKTLLFDPHSPYYRHLALVKGCFFTLVSEYGSDSFNYPLHTTPPPFKGSTTLTRGTSAVIDIHNTSPTRPLQIEYPAVLKKTMCFWGVKYYPSPSPLGLRKGSEGGKTRGWRVLWRGKGLPGFHIRGV